MTRARPDPCYPGGFPAILRQMAARLDPLTYAAGEALPPLDVDFAPLKTTLVDRAATALGPVRSSFARKRRELAAAFHRQPELLLLHGLVVANLRRSSQPPHCAALFQRLWAEEGDFLRAQLDARWLVSAVTTFGDHGATEPQRRLGQSLTVLFGLMKLYETERLYSGYAPDAAFPAGKRAAKLLPLDMDAYAIAGGGLDVNLLGRLWLDAAADPVLGPLARDLLDRLITDRGGLFSRLRAMRSEKQAAVADTWSEAEPQGGPAAGPETGSDTGPETSPETGPERPKGRRRKAPKRPAILAPVPLAAAQIGPERQMRWGTVSLVRADAAAIRRFAAHHLDLGASEVHLYVDAPDATPAAMPAATSTATPDAEQDTSAAWADLTGHPALRVTVCDAAWWARQPKPRMPAHQMRQGWVATQCYGQAAGRLDWLAHIDVDEFLLPARPVAAVLADVAADQAGLLLPAVELLAETGPPADVARFKTTPRMAGQDKSVLARLYPTFGAHLRGGYISHLEGKMFARTGIPGLRMGVHELVLDGASVQNRAQGQDILLGHAHAPDWATFRAHLDFRLTQGSYRKSEDTGFRLSDVLAYLQDSEGEAGLRLFFDEVCSARPDLVAALQDLGMLVTWPLDLDGAVARHFIPRRAAADAPAQTDQRQP